MSALLAVSVIMTSGQPDGTASRTSLSRDLVHGAQGSDFSQAFQTMPVLALAEASLALFCRLPFPFMFYLLLWIMSPLKVESGPVSCL